MVAVTTYTEQSSEWLLQKAFRVIQKYRQNSASREKNTVIKATFLTSPILERALSQLYFLFLFFFSTFLSKGKNAQKVYLRFKSKISHFVHAQSSCSLCILFLEKLCRDYTIVPRHSLYIVQPSNTTSNIYLNINECATIFGH